MESMDEAINKSSKADCNNKYIGQSTSELSKKIDEMIVELMNNKCKPKLEEFQKKVNENQKRIADCYAQIKSYQSKIGDYNDRIALCNEYVSNINHVLSNDLPRLKAILEEPVDSYKFKLKDDEIKCYVSEKELDIFTESLKLKKVRGYRPGSFLIKDSYDALVFAKALTETFLSEKPYVGENGATNLSEMLKDVVQKYNFRLPTRALRHKMGRLVYDAIKIVTGNDYSYFIRINRGHRAQIKRDLEGKF